MTHGHGQQGGMDCGSRGWGGMEEGKGGKTGSAVIEKNKNKINKPFLLEKKEINQHV